MEISVSSNQTRIEIDRFELIRKTSQVLEDLGCSPTTSLSIAFVDSEEMAELNLKYRGKEGPTNVLSFSQQEGESPGTQQGLLGDVVICAERVREDALKLGYTEEEMVLYLLIHGILHLTGYDHADPDEAVAMQEKVDLIFQRFYSSETTT
ncbi:MAG: rRNA maturation RNase YbeY [Desulfomonilaceae bacterium]|nr:rRNA maturation RNase YbeY [Desulfomonilaceae bacterium]